PTDPSRFPIGPGSASRSTGTPLPSIRPRTFTSTSSRTAGSGARRSSRTEPAMAAGDLEGRRALVTGAAGGIGQSIAWALGDAGARVAVHTANSAPDETLARLRDGVAVKADLRDVQACRAAVDEAAS